MSIEDSGASGPSFIERSGRLDSALFGDLGEKTSDIKGIFSDIDGRLLHVETLATDISELRRKFGHFLKLYRDLALLNVALGRDKERLEADLLTASEAAAQSQEDAQRLRITCDDHAAKLEKAQAASEAYEQNMQLLGVARRELEARLEESQSALGALGDEESVLRRENDALKARIHGDEQRIRDLSEKYQSSFEQATSLRERCQVLESELRAKAESFATQREENLRLAHEVERLAKDNASLEKLVSESRADMSAAFDRYQTEARAREDQLSEAKNQLKTARSGEQTLQKINGDLKAENEVLAKDLRTALESDRQNAVQITRSESRISRLAAEVETALAARNQLDQARLAMVARVEALTQAVRAGEVDIKRLENEVGSLAQTNQDLKAGHAVSTEQLSLRIRELEGQLEHQINENAYLASKFAKAGDF